MPNDTRKAALALAIAQGQTVAEAAKALGIAERTAYRWAAGPGFKAEVDGCRRALIDKAVGRLAAVALDAANTLAELNQPDQPWSARLRASRAILQSLIAVQSHFDLAERVAELERRLSDGAQSPGRSPVD